jgi:hypothetical protein
MSKTPPPVFPSLRLRRAAPDATALVGAYGGHPRGIRSHQWPRCAVCGSAMCHMAQIDAGPWLDLGKFARMSVFICHATGGRCEDWDPWKGANRVLLHATKDDALYDGPPVVRVYRRVRLVADPPIDDRAVLAAAKQAGTLDAAKAELKHDKLNGVPVWLTGDDTPRSPSGKDRMRLLLQMTTGVVAFDITRGGMAWVFLDPHDPSETAAKLMWQGG